MSRKLPNLVQSLALLTLGSVPAILPAQAPPPVFPTARAGAGAGTSTAPPARSDLELVERLLAARRDYQNSLEQLRAYYQSIGDMERMRWAEEEVRQFHRIPKQAYSLELDVPPPTLQANQTIAEATELYRRAMTFKDKGWGNDYIDNQRRAEILLQQLLTNYPQSDKISDAAYQLGDLYEGRAFKQYRRSAQYFERAFQWNPNAPTDSRLRAARLYDRNLAERTHAVELYKLVVAHDTDPRRTEEAKKRLTELSGGK